MKAIPIEQLLAIPIQSAIRAQNLGVQATLAAIEAFGLDSDNKAAVFRMTAEQTTEERAVDSATGKVTTTQVTRPFELSIPLLALLPVSGISLQEMNVDLAIEVVDVRSQQLQLRALPAEVTGPSLVSTLGIFATQTPVGPAMQVRMHLLKDTPEGLARVGDVLTGLLSGRGQQGRPVNDIPGMPPETIAILRNRGILTVPQFLSITEPVMTRADFAKSIGVSLAQLEAWRKAAASLPPG
jgi:uncharacterized protein DUF2589